MLAYFFGLIGAVSMLLSNRQNECTKVQNPRRNTCVTEMHVTESIQKFCEQRTETKEKEARCLTLSHIPSSV